jgi:hypothetical protein
MERESSKKRVLAGFVLGVFSLLAVRRLFYVYLRFLLRKRCGICGEIFEFLMIDWDGNRYTSRGGVLSFSDNTLHMVIGLSCEYRKILRDEITAVELSQTIGDISTPKRGIRLQLVDNEKVLIYLYRGDVRKLYKEIRSGTL